MTRTMFTFLILPPVLFFFLACVLVWAVSDLVRFVDRRTPLKIGLAVAGLIGWVLGAWWWYVNVASVRGPMP